MRARDLKALEFDKIVALIAGLAVSEPGRRAAAALHPSTDVERVRAQLRATAELVELRARAGGLPLGEFIDQRELMLAVAPEGAVLGGEALVKLRDFVIVARTAAAFLRSRVEALHQLGALARNLVAPKELADAMLRALADDGGLLDDASPELKRLRTRMRDQRLELETRLGRSLNDSGMAPFVSDYIVTVRNRRFVLPLKPNFTERLDGVVQDRSVSGETLFVEPMWAVELNNRLMLLEREAAAEEYRLLMRLSAMVRGYAHELGLTFTALTELDALNARAQFAERCGGVEPTLADDGVELIAARHPLLIASGRTTVPIDLRVGPGQRGIVISGPNTGGKTVALKTLGLFALMAQAGILIPAAAGSRLKVFGGVFADIGDEQSIAASLSSFAAHVVNLTDIVTSLREPALVILDEPGGGTDPIEGAALAIGLMDYLAARDCIVAVATHSTAVKLHAYSRAGFDAAAVDFDEARLEPLYRLKPHTIGQSYGLAVARRLGFPEAIVAAAEAAMPAGSTELAETLRRLETERIDLKLRSDALAAREAHLTDRERAAEATIEQAQARIDAERAELRAGGAALLDEIRRDGANLMAELKNRNKGRSEFSRMLADAAAKVDAAAPTTDASPAESVALHAGDQVELGGLRGELLAIEPGKAIFGRGGLRIEVAPERLRRAGPPRPSTQLPTVAVVTPSSAAAELNLIGERTSDALRKLEEFLDQAYLTNQTEIRVAHGIGSGTLKKAIHDYLSASPYCASFRQAEPHQGGAGATIVTLGD
ncbi:MAG TPA: Smr/MutS family protein [Candidatus Binataceae bacterium]|nr:Smr/MutS family protein [Candidatus Binataceae bacterium]